MNAPDYVLTVGQLNGYVGRLLAADSILQNVRLKGEISNFKRHAATGHWYFSLKDESGAIACVLFRQYQFGIAVAPADGMQVELTGSVGLYVKTGAYQFYATGMKETGQGDLFARFEALKSKLEAEGLFAVSRKRPLPAFPKKIGIVTSASGAVIHDIIQVSRRRNPAVQLCLCPASVQGQGAEKTVIAAMRQLILSARPDVLIIARGGGSMEDLWPFNEETLARAIALCPVPVISAVGHETDFTIADFVADMRAPTPSAAAEIAVPDLNEIRGAVSVMREKIYRSAMQTIAITENTLLLKKNRLAHCSPSSALEKQSARLSACLACLQNEPAALAKLQLRLSGSASSLQTAAEESLATLEHRTALLKTRLEGLSPTHILSRGYAMVQQGKNVVDSIAQMKQNEDYSLTMADGTALIRTLSVKNGEANGSKEERNL